LHRGRSGHRPPREREKSIVRKPGIYLLLLALRPQYTPSKLVMSAELVRRTISMTLGQLVDLYLSLAGQFSRRVSLSSFQLSPEETERLFSSYDEDYHISRFFHFTEAHGAKFSIDGVPATHVSIDPEIRSIL
jgi:hypothetical protein